MEIVLIVDERSKSRCCLSRWNAIEFGALLGGSGTMPCQKMEGQACMYVYKGNIGMKVHLGQDGTWKSYEHNEKHGLDEIKTRLGNWPAE